MNAMRTGNVVLDMVIAMSIPLALKWFREQWHWLGPLIVNFILRTRQTEERYTRIIEYEKVSPSTGRVVVTGCLNGWGFPFELMFFP